MDKGKQINELAEAIFQNCNFGIWFSEAEKIADFVINNQGYRKASEIFEEIMPMLLDYQNNFVSGLQLITFIKELKKKYTESVK